MWSTSFSTGENEHIREKRLYLPSFFRMIPQPEVGKPLCGYFSSAFMGGNPYYAEIPPGEVSTMLPPRASSEIDFKPWAVGTSKKLPIWTDTDYKRLNLPVMAPTIKGTATPTDTEGRFIDPFESGRMRPIPGEEG